MHKEQELKKGHSIKKYLLLENFCNLVSIHKRNELIRQKRPAMVNREITDMILYRSMYFNQRLGGGSLGSHLRLSGVGVQKDPV